MPVRDANTADSRLSFTRNSAGRSPAFAWLGIIGLTAACGLWMILLSPRTISGLPATGAANRQRQAKPSSQALPAAKPAVAIVALAAPMVIPAEDVPAGLKISPEQAKMSVGKTQKFRLVDQNGRAVPGATWMVSDFTVAELDSVEPARIAAVAPGEVTVTAMLGDQSVRAKVTVVKPPVALASTARSSEKAPRGR